MGKPEPNTKVKCEKCSKIFLSNHHLEKHQNYFCQKNHAPDEDSDDQPVIYVPDMGNDPDAMDTNLNPEPMDLSISPKVKCEKCSKMFVSKHELQKHLIY